MASVSGASTVRRLFRSVGKFMPGRRTVGAPGLRRAVERMPQEARPTANSLHADRPCEGSPHDLRRKGAQIDQVAHVEWEAAHRHGRNRDLQQAPPPAQAPPVGLVGTEAIAKPPNSPLRCARCSGVSRAVPTDTARQRRDKGWKDGRIVLVAAAGQHFEERGLPAEAGSSEADGPLAGGCEDRLLRRQPRLPAAPGGAAGSRCRGGTNDCRPRARVPTSR